jgi:hypothetical protein
LDFHCLRPLLLLLLLLLLFLLVLLLLLVVVLLLVQVFMLLPLQHRLVCRSCAPLVAAAAMHTALASVHLFRAPPLRAHRKC